jgi:DNA-binding PadR family transcriptional regulator
MIIQSILEGILSVERNKSHQRNGIIKSHLIDYCGLKATSAEKYLLKLEKAGYIDSHVEPWGERTIKIYQITSKGRERHKWFVEINTEMEEIV